MTLFDAHNHIQFSSKRGISADFLLQNLLEHGIPCASASTCESDWSILLDLHSQYSEAVHVGLGVHPWWADTVSKGWVERLEALLLANPSTFVGESGLDVYRASRPRGTTLDAQCTALLPQLALARKLQRPIVLHCVKAWEQLRSYLKSSHCSHFAIHRFKGSAQMAQEAVRMGGYLSLHLDSIWHPETQFALRNVPLQRLLIETDYDGPRPESIPFVEELQSLLSELGKIVGQDPALLAEITYSNALSFYGIDSKKLASSMQLGEHAVRT